MKPVKFRQVAMVAGLLVAGWLALFADKTPDQPDGVVAAAVKAPAPAQARQATSTRHAGSGKAKAERIVPILAVLPRAELITVGHTDLAGKQRKDGSESDALFATHSWLAQTQANTKPPEPPAPVAPPLRLKYLGRKFEDGSWQVFLAQNDTTYIVGVQSVIDNKYRVDVINPNFVMLTYLPLNQPQRLNTRGPD